MRLQCGGEMGESKVLSGESGRYGWTAKIIQERQSETPERCSRHKLKGETCAWPRWDGSPFAAPDRLTCLFRILIWPELCVNRGQGRSSQGMFEAGPRANLSAWANIGVVRQRVVDEMELSSPRKLWGRGEATREWTMGEKVRQTRFLKCSKNDPPNLCDPLH